MGILEFYNTLCCSLQKLSQKHRSLTLQLNDYKITMWSYFTNVFEHDSCIEKVKDYYMG